MPERVVACVYVGCVGLLATAVAICIYQLPLQVSDNLDKVISAAERPLTTTLREYTTGETFRPLSGLFAEAISTRWIDNPGRAQRAINALQSGVIVALVGLLLRPTTAFELALALVAVFAFVGHLSFWETFTEGYPVNHFGVVVLCFLGVLHLLQRQHLSRIALTSVIVLCTIATASVELGVVCVAAVACRLLVPMPERRGALSISVVTIVACYAIVRLVLLSSGTPGIGGHSSGFGFIWLESQEIVNRFGEFPLIWGFHNAVMTVLSLALSDPFNGRWDIAWRAVSGDLRVVDGARVILAIGMLCVLLVGMRANAREGPSGQPSRLFPILALAVTLAASAVLNYRYVKTVLIVPALACYVWVFYQCARALFCEQRPRGSAALVFGLAVVAALPVVDLPCEIWLRATEHRNQWAYLSAQDSYRSSNAWANVVASRMRTDAVNQPIPRDVLEAEWGVCGLRRSFSN